MTTNVTPIPPSRTMRSKPIDLGKAGKAIEQRRGLSPLDVISQWRNEGALERLSTGWPTFDSATRGGFVLGRLGFLLGAPNAHKTAALACLAWRWLHDGVAVGVLCVDEDAHDFLTRLAVMSGVSLDEAETRADATLARIEKAIGKLPLKLYGPEWTIEAAAADLHACMKRQGITRGAFLADSVQTISCDASLDASSLRTFVGANVKALSGAAPRHRLAVIATGEIPRAHYDSGKRSDMAATKESGAGEYAAKIQCVLRRAKRNDALVHVSVPKIKRGSKDETEFYLRFDRERHTLTEDAVPAASGTDPLLRARILDAIGSQELTSATTIWKAVGGKKQIALAAVKAMLGDGSLVLDGEVYRRGKS